MPWNHLYSPLDQTVDRLDWLAKQLREDLTGGTEFTRDDGFAVLGAQNAELILQPGETRTLKWIPRTTGVYPFYCTDFCSALHQEMQGYVRVSPNGASTPLKANVSKKAQTQVARAAKQAAERK